MRQLEKIKANQILGTHKPELLYSNSLSQAKQEYRTLAALWHPDKSNSAESRDVFERIVQLYNNAKYKIETSRWDEPYQKLDEEESGKRLFLTGRKLKTIDYLSIRQFELGTMYIGDHTVCFELDRENYQDLFDNARKQIRQLRFEDSEMAVEMSRSLPQIEDLFETKHSSYLVLRKTPDQFLLADIIKHYSGRIEPIEHLGWILNVLLNMVCYLEWSGLTHNAIAADTVFISPLRHSGMLLGGWWYCRNAGEELTALPDRSMAFIPADILASKLADSRADLELVKALGRELLGLASDKAIQDESELPDKLPEWLNSCSSGRALDDYRCWKYEVLEHCFGTPYFVPMNLDKFDLYKEI